MPVQSPNQPSVAISVPVPTPVQNKPKPASIPKGDEDEGQPQLQTTPAPRPQRIPPQLKAVILPWTPGSRKMSRLPEKVIKMAKSDRPRLPGELSEDGMEIYEPDEEPSMSAYIAGRFRQDYGDPVPGIDPSVGFLLPDGYGVPMGPGQRYEDHRGAIPTHKAMVRWGWPEEITRRYAEGTRTPALFETMRRAQAVRVHSTGDELNLQYLHQLTPQQKRAILSHVKEYRPSRVIISKGIDQEDDYLENPTTGHIARVLNNDSPPTFHQESTEPEKLSRSMRRFLTRSKNA